MSSFREQLGRQDTIQLLTLGASLSLVYSSTTLGVTNFALFLFGIVAHENTSSTVPFRQFINLILFTEFFDLLRLSSVGFPSISGICALLVMLLKVPVFFSCVAKLQERGGDFRLGVPDWNSVQSARQNWNMGGGSGGQTLGGGQGTFGHGPNAPPPPGAFPSGGGFRLGGDDDDNSGPGHQPPAPAPGRNGYSSIA
ncbi:hypothetical protein DB88DRAFT_471856 [Papiliotrema laurentii]|uniref:Uncharacterized protein n=1 Tax=Papiliotrema laurentii TaxID=5418 RepID=A0AAD9L756_PAPLA|nr:hypothetical protein DB88DRAFT_471856 [Papiliotrema laurentii]